MRMIRSERIDVLARSHGYFPTAFRWRGRRFEVAAVEKCWTVQHPTLRRMFRVRCATGSFVLEQRLADDAWQVSRWPLTMLLPRPKPAAPARFPLPRSQRRPERQPLAGQPARVRTDKRPAWTPASQRL